MFGRDGRDLPVEVFEPAIAHQREGAIRLADGYPANPRRAFEWRSTQGKKELIQQEDAPMEHLLPHHASFPKVATESA